MSGMKENGNKDLNPFDKAIRILIIVILGIVCVGMVAVGATWLIVAALAIWEGAR